MKHVIVIIIALMLFGPGDGKKSGRAGNAHYEAERYEQAESAYREGIVAARDAGVDPVHAGLLNNLGATLYRRGDFENAAASFAGGVRMSPDVGGLVRGSYNAGNAAFRMEDLESALEFFRTTLLNDPTDQDAKYNYEFVKRRLEEQQEQEQNQQQEQQDSEDEQQQGPNQTQNPDQEQEERQNEQQQQGDEQQQGQDQEQQQDEQQQQTPTNPEQLSEAEAQRILQALENEEQQLLRQVQKMNARPRRVEKDW